MKKNLLFFLLLSLFAFNQAFAQSRTVTGTVTGADDGAGIPGATVRLRGSARGVSTDASGKFSITVPYNAILTVSFIGYESQDFTIPSNGVLDVKLVPNNKQLNEVVVTGYGSGTRASDVVGSVARVGAKQLEDRPVANVLDALQGKVAGLSVLSSSGEPSATPSLMLHGLGSLGSGSTMLVMLDGVQTSMDNILSLNPNDIADVSVLKDAASTSIYGSRASNGVLVITTKRGSANRPASVTLSSQYSVNKIANTDFYNSFMNRQQYTDFYVGAGFYNSLADFNNNVIDKLEVKNADTRWYKVYYKNSAPTYQENISVNGGGDKTTYYVSASYLNADGLAYRSNYDRWTVRSNINSKITNWLEFNMNIALANDNRETNPYGSNSTNRGLALLAEPYISPVDPNGNPYNTIPVWNRVNPKYGAEEHPDPNNKVQANPNAYLLLTPIKGLSIKTAAGIDGYDYRETAITLPSYNGTYNGSTAEYFTRYVSKTFTNTVEYKFSVEKNHHFTALAGQEYNDAQWSNFSGSSTGQSDDRLIGLAQGPNGIAVGSYKTDYAYNSFFGRLDYDFKSKYFLEGSIRSDKSSLFGENHRTGTFWSAGLNWKAKTEDFLKNVSWIDDLSVRVNTGTQGNSDFGFASTGAVNDNYKSLETVNSVKYGSNNGYYFAMDTGNPNLTWEKQQLTTFGVTASLFNALRLDVSYYIRNTSSMLIYVPSPYTSGSDSQLANTGTLQNKGFDISIDGDVWKDPSHKAYITPFIIANINHNKVTALFQGKDYWVIPNTGVSWVIGQQVQYFYPIYKGVNPQTGAPEWYLPDANNPQKTRKDPNAVTSEFNGDALQQSTGISQYPWLTGSFGLRGGYGGFTISAMFNFALGKHMINNDRYFYENPTLFAPYNQSTRVANYWKKPGDNALFPDINNYDFTQFDSSLIENASFMRLKELTLGYSLPTSLLAKTKAIKGVRFYAVGRNLFTVTKYLGPDPEVDSNLALGSYPNTKQYSFGVDVTF